MIVGPAPTRACRGPPTDRAVLHGLRVRGRGIGGDPAGTEHPCFELGFEPPVVSGEVGDAQAVALAVAGEDVAQHRLDPLDACDPLGVRRQLQDCGCLHRPGELGVGHFVGPVAQLARTRNAFEEVGVARPATVEEDALVDDVGPRLHRGGGFRGAALQVHASARLGGDGDDGSARDGQFGSENCVLVFASESRQNIEERVLAIGTRQFTAGRREFELGEVRARGETREIRWAQYQLVVEDSHDHLPARRDQCLRPL